MSDFLYMLILHKQGIPVMFPVIILQDVCVLVCSVTSHVRLSECWH